MPMCINCGSDKVERQGDAFTCHKCQFQWDVAFEQANKVYLRAQGRQPATSVLDSAGQADAVMIATDTPAIPSEPPSAVSTPEATTGEGQTDGAATPPAVAPAAHLSFGGVGSEAATNGTQVEPADDPEPPSADPLPKAATTPAPETKPPSTAKSKKG